MVLWKGKYRDTSSPPDVFISYDSIWQKNKSHSLYLPILSRCSWRHLPRQRQEDTRCWRIHSERKAGPVLAEWCHCQWGQDHNSRASESWWLAGSVDGGRPWSRGVCPPLWSNGPGCDCWENAKLYSPYFEFLNFKEVLFFFRKRKPYWFIEYIYRVHDYNLSKNIIYRYNSWTLFQEWE